MSHAVATIQFVLHHFLKQSTASLRKDRVLKMKSVLLSVLFIALLLVSRQKERGKQQSIKSEKFLRTILVSLWLHIDGAPSITIYNNEKLYFFFVVTMPLFTFFFAREKWSAIDEVCAKLHGNWTVTGRWSWKTIESQQKTSARVHSIIIFAVYREQRLLQRWAVFDLI